MEQSKALIGWCAGLFDGEGSVNYAQYKCKQPNGKTSLKWNVGMEISMTHLETIHHFYQIINHIGSIRYKKNSGYGRKDQWRWRCSHQKALTIAKLLFPYSLTKRPNLLKIINHYEFTKPIGSLGKKFNFLKTIKTSLP